MGGKQSREDKARKIAKDYVIMGVGGPHMLEDLQRDNPILYRQVVIYIGDIIEKLSLSPSQIRNIGPLRAEDTQQWIRANMPSNYGMPKPASYLYEN